MNSISRSLAPIVVGLAVPLALLPPRADANPADPVTPQPAPEPTPRPLEHPYTAADVATAPVPGAESGRIDRVYEGDSNLRVAARDALFLPKLAFEAVMFPIHGTMWAYDRYQLYPLYYRLFYNTDHTIALIPTAGYQTGFGLTVGARFQNLNTFGDGELLTMEATAGGSFRAYAAGGVDTGMRLGRLKLGVAASFSRNPSDAFTGIGNGDLNSQPAAPVDALTNPLAYRTYTRFQVAQAQLIAGVRIYDGLAVYARGQFSDLRFGPSSTGTPIEDVYLPASLIGFNTGVRQAYGEFELRYDTRRRATVWEPLGIPSEGSLVSGRAGYVGQLFGAPGNFWHYTIDLQQLVRLATGPRLLAFRLYGEGVSGNLDQIPFLELPSLGGDYLRGYEYNRFHDRLAAFATAQYQWDVSRYVDAYVFTDAGRVYPSFDELTLDNLRVGFGVGVEVHSDQGFVISGTLASSIDGGVVVTASFNPAFNNQPRWP